MSTQPSDLTIIIVGWNTRDLVAQCLDSIKAEQQSIDSSEQTPKVSIETIFVDNASHDGTAEMIQQNYPFVRLIQNRENVGFAVANNQAIALSGGRYILLLNPDTIIRPGALHTMLSFIEARPEVGAIGPKLLNPNGSLQLSCHPLPTLFREFWRLFHLDVVWRYAEYPVDEWKTEQAVDILQGACLLLRGATIDEVGGLDEAYFIYSEEVDLCRRIQQAGWQLFWLPQAEVIHYGGQSTQQVSAPMFLRLYESKIIYFRKHYGTVAARLYKTILAVAAIIRLLLLPVVWLEPKHARRRHLTLAQHYYHLLQALAKY